MPAALTKAQKQRRRKQRRAWRAGRRAAIPPPPGLGPQEEEVMDWFFPETQFFEKIDDDDPQDSTADLQPQLLEGAALPVPQLDYDSDLEGEDASHSTPYESEEYDDEGNIECSPILAAGTSWCYGQPVLPPGVKVNQGCRIKDPAESGSDENEADDRTVSARARAADGTRAFTWCTRSDVAAWKAASRGSEGMVTFLQAPDKIKLELVGSYLEFVVDWMDYSALHLQLIQHIDPLIYTWTYCETWPGADQIAKEALVNTFCNLQAKKAMEM